MSDSWGQEDRREELSLALASGAYTAVDWAAGMHSEKQGWDMWTQHICNQYLKRKPWESLWIPGLQQEKLENWPATVENAVLWLHKPGPISPSLACFTLYLCTNQTTMQVESKRNPVLREGPLGSQHHPWKQILVPFSQHPSLSNLSPISQFAICFKFILSMWLPSQGTQIPSEKTVCNHSNE